MMKTTPIFATSRARSTWAAGAAFAVLAGLIAFGCGGSDGVKVPDFQQNAVNSQLSSYQSMAGISGFVRRAMQAAAPNNAVVLAEDENGFDKGLGLYVGDPEISGNTLTYRFWVDQAKTDPAGLMTVSMAGSEWNRSYAAYPAVVTTHIDVDKGHHAGTGDFTVAYQSSVGDSQVAGGFHLDQNDIDTTLNLATNNNGQVTGGWSTAANGTSVNITNLQGNIDGEWTGNMAVQPHNWTGTLTATPDTGAYAAAINTSLGPITVGVDATDKMTISHGGKQIVLPNALAAGFTINGNPSESSGGATGGESSGGSTGLTSTSGGSNGGETNGGSTGLTSTSGTSTTGETTGETNGGSTSSGTTGFTTGETTGSTTTTGETNGSTTSGTTGSTTGETTGSTTTTGETNGSTTSGTTGSTTGETTGSTTTGTSGSTSSGTTGSTTGETTGSTTTGTSGSTTGETTGGSSSTSTGGTTGSTGETTGTTGGTSGGSSTSTTGETTGSTGGTSTSTTGGSSGSTSGTNG